MTIDELKKACMATDPLTGGRVQHIYLTLPMKTLPRGDTIALAGRRGPRGKICNVQKEGEGYICVANFSTTAILSYLDTSLTAPAQPQSG